MAERATGPFDVKLSPQTAYNTDPTALLGRMSIDKEFHGDLEAKSKGEMLTAGSTIQGSAAYVAVERVTGTLKGKRGSFALQHMGTMTRGTPALAISIVPDSATDELEGLKGTMSIDISNGKHSYVLDYTLPNSS
jgi:hypothetical protein